APRVLLRNLAQDQRQIWTSPFKARIQDLNWLVPFAGLTAGLINADAEISSRVDTTGTFSKHSSTLSNGGVAAMVGGAGGLYLLGSLRSDEHQKETGILAGEAAINSVVVVEAIRALTRRARPNEGSGLGEFGKGSALHSGFPSMHAALAWSAATVLTHEYPGVMTKILGYGLATTVSIARVTGKDHFPSDVLVGSALGWMIGEQVYGAHHNPELRGEGYGTFHRGLSEEFPGWQSKSSPYVPMDSWVYPAIDRLSALGAVHSGIAGLRPWTRRECARILEEAEADSSVDPYAPDGGEASRLYAALAREFSSEMEGPEAEYVSLDSVYTRVTGISGRPLTDGYHFGQTIVNDFGRPYQQGVNGLAGFSTSGSSGPLGFYVRGEFVHAPSAPGVSQAIQDSIQLGDAKVTTGANFGQPIFQPATPIAAISTFRLLDSYVMLNVNGWQTSFGKQTLWTGPTQDPFLWSNNAEPMYMFRVDQTTPTKLPSFMGFLGPMRTEFWVGRLTGQHYVNTQDNNISFRLGRTLSRQPLVNGLKVNFKPTPNFEFGVGRTGLWGGPEFPINLHTTRRSFLSTTNAAGRGNDPGDRRSTFDFSYRIPKLRNWLTLYDDSFVEDETSPIGYPRRSAHNPGIYLSHLPGLPHLDFRAEAAFTNLPELVQPVSGGFFYWNVRYLDGYTNQGNIIGNATVGRQGVALRAETTYWFASDKTVQLGYRSNIVDSFFLEGGNLRDVHLKSEWSFGSKVSLSAFLQYEWWNFPLLTAGNKQNDFTASFQLTYWPHWRIKRGS
ncbi:MAG TPA: capsule assembly Wzi family protein, partial [Candidatus Angelobacter sp.]|nr:capsule assembly Wzi family protein [Candidatus Angelobacter sp.]